MSIRRRQSVALLIETSNAYARGLLDGVVAWVRRYGTWSVFLPEQGRGAPPPAWLDEWQGDGIIARVENEEIARAIERTGLPTVDVSAARLLPDVPWVETDDRAIAEAAAEHLIERGFRRFGFCGDAGFEWSGWRQRYFTESVERAGFECHVHSSVAATDPTYTWDREKAGLAEWIGTLPRPVGVMACYDIKAQQLLEVCRELDVAVPEEIAVVGVDDDRLLCELSDPPLSSVVPNTRRTGYEAATLLDRMMSGEEVTTEAVLVPPTGVTTRQSTDILAIDDPDVATALRRIREGACAGITVADILRHVTVSRRVLESRFTKLLGRTPHAEITRLRMDRAKRLLAETDLTLVEIADLSGFQHAEYLSVAFKREVGRTPSAFRRDAQL